MKIEHYEILDYDFKITQICKKERNLPMKLLSFIAVKDFPGEVLSAVKCSVKISEDFTEGN